MPELKETLSTLEFYTKRISRLKEDLQECLNSPLPKSRKDELQVQIEQNIQSVENGKLEELNKLINFPPHHSRHFSLSENFATGGSYDKSVFIMTKFPDNVNPQPIDVELSNIIQFVKDAITQSGYIPRIASEKKYHPILWDNVELFLFGCSKGVAIVESKYKQELNPNVTMEWGWMRGMGKDILYLAEQTFDLARADIGGLIEDKFKWEDPKKEINTAIKKWLGAAV
jgi:hypothetical protein